MIRNIEKYGSYYILLSFPLIITFLSFGLSTRICDLILKSTILVGIFLLLSKKRKFILGHSRLLIFIFAYLTYNFITIFFTDGHDASEITKNLKYIFYLLGFLCVFVNFYDDYERYSNKLSYFLFPVSVSALISSIYFFLNGDVRLTNIFRADNPIHDAAFYGFCSIFLVHQFTRKNTIAKLILFSSALLFLSFAIFLSGSRSIVYSLFLVGAICLLYARNKLILIPMLIIISIFCLYQNISFFITNSEIKVAVENATNFIERGVSGRFNIWQLYLSEMSIKDMLIGKGYYIRHDYSHMYPNAFHPHNALLFSFFNGGIVLLGLHLCILFECFLVGLRNFREKKSPLILMIFCYSLLPQLTNGIRIYCIDVRFPDMVIIFWTMVGIALKESASNDQKELSE